MATKARETKQYYYIGLFILFGLLIAFCTSVVNYRLELVSIEKKLGQQAEAVFQNKLTDLESYTRGLEDIVSALRDNGLLLDYLKAPSPQGYHNVCRFFQGIALSHEELMQVRYLDREGREVVRVDRDRGSISAEIIPEDRLQDKGHRYYFIESSQTQPYGYWYSRLDLNIENKKIEVPYKPVLRLASPLYLGQQFQGIVIINVHVKEFLQKFSQNSLFDICLIDREGYYLKAHQDNFSWSRYLETGFSVYSHYPEQAQQILFDEQTTRLKAYGTLFVGSLKALLKKDEGLLLLHARDDAVQSLQEERQRAALLIVTIILLLSIPLALIISRGPVKLHRKIAEQNRALSESMGIIDNNVAIATLDLEGRFKEGSTAFARSLGVSREQLTGMHSDRLRSQDLPGAYYDDIWASVQDSEAWSGEVQYSRLNGNCYWADTLILPQRDEDGELSGYSAIYQDITDKKRIEQLSITDVMTGLYNRRFFNVVIEKELNRARRSGRYLAFAMLDVDYFKQYNDHYGHQKGDSVLQEVAAIIAAKVSRGSDACFRLGGEEFGILFTEVDPWEAQKFVDSIRLAMVEKGIEHRWSSVSEVITVSLGLLSVLPDESVSVDLVYRLADEALYEAKESGRNRVVARTLDTGGRRTG
ncbi:sensor domain-containing diguanylate cyclase [Desulfogranum mediterraneum]|uniref:sensor domain-containing diguanylate cyclase n=1 Tax=Desulfogranum mediterraneum TaxID=160661 RepID=UPI0013784980|nr:sensor domain-containing diguanylate cyclase [Desulfogranum mediterraneum]